VKYLMIVIVLSCLSGCATTSPERLKQAEEYEKRSDRAYQNAVRTGELAGTPDNVEYMEKSYEEASVYQDKAHDAKYANTFFSFLWGLAFD